MIIISPSLLAADFSKLRDEVVAIENAGADMLHLDVMDGHFVPNISFGSSVIKAIRACSNIYFDTHLMISDPLIYLDDFISAGVDSISFHVESNSPIHKTVDIIHGAGIKAGLVVKPATKAESVFPYLSEIDSVTIMTVEPGFGGQSFMSDMIHKSTEIITECRKIDRVIDIQVDGGINARTACIAASVGINNFVAGTSVFGAKDRKCAIEEIRLAAENTYIGF